MSCNTPLRSVAHVLHTLLVGAGCGDAVLLQLRTVQAIVTHLEDHPVHRARAACARARYFASYTYGALDGSRVAEETSAKCSTWPR